MLRGHRAEVDEGAEVAWELDKERGYVSALQWAMTVKISQPAFFRAELQQEGNPRIGGPLKLSPDLVVKRLSRVEKGEGNPCGRLCRRTDFEVTHVGNWERGQKRRRHVCKHCGTPYRSLQLWGVDD